MCFPLLGLSAAAVALLAASAAVGVATTVVSYTEQKKQAKKARKSADIEASQKRLQVDNEARLAVKEQGENKITAQISAKRQLGVIQNLQNRGGNQISSLILQADRESGTLNNKIGANIKRIEAERRQSFANIEFSRRNIRAANKGPSGLSLAIGLAGSLVGGLGGLASAAGSGGGGSILGGGSSFRVA